MIAARGMRDDILKFANFRKAIKHGLAAQTVLDRLNRIGPKLDIFYLVIEGDCQEDPAWAIKFLEYETRQLTSADIPEMARIHPWDNLDALTARMRDGQVCIALYHNNQLAAFNWANLEKCVHEPYTFDLDPDAAYIYDAFTLHGHRGKDLLPFLRCETYKFLKSIHRHRYFSVSEFFNKPSIRFKKKLQSNFDKLFVTVSFDRKKYYRWVVWK